jgi:hypothetical protein
VGLQPLVKVCADILIPTGAEACVPAIPLIRPSSGISGHCSFPFSRAILRSTATPAFYRLIYFTAKELLRDRFNNVFIEVALIDDAKDDTGEGCFGTECEEPIVSTHPPITTTLWVG